MSEDDIQRYEQMLADDPESRAFAPLAEAYRKAQRLDDAIRTARAGLEVHPGYSGGLLVLGRALYETRELDPAAEVLQKAVADNPENYLGQKFLGKALKDKGDTQGALRALEAANFLSPEDGEVVELLEEMKKKADPPKKMEFEAGSGRETEESELVTYEQKPTTVDGVELTPIPVSEAFSFTPAGEDVTTDPAAVRPAAAQPAPDSQQPGTPTAPQADSESSPGSSPEPAPTPAPGPAPVPSPEAAPLPGSAIDDVVDEVVDGVEDDEMAVIEIAEDEFDGIGDDDLEDVAGVVQVDDMEDIDAFDPEIAAFIEEGEQLAEVEAEVEAEAEDDLMNGALAEAPVPAAEQAPPVEQVPVEAAPDLEPIPQAALGEMELPEIPAPEPEPALDLDLGLDSEVTAPPETMGFQPASSSSLDASATGGAISTETLADLYAQQGLTDKALEIYRQILLEKPEDEVIKLKISALAEAFDEPGSQPSVQEPAPLPVSEPEPQAEPLVAPPVAPTVAIGEIQAPPVVQVPETVAAAPPAPSAPIVPGVTEDGVAPEPPAAPAPQVDEVPAMPPMPEAAGNGMGADDASETLGQWLENAERMKPK